MRSRIGRSKSTLLLAWRVRRPSTLGSESPQSYYLSAVRSWTAPGFCSLGPGSNILFRLLHFFHHPRRPLSFEIPCAITLASDRPVGLLGPGGAWHPLLNDGPLWRTGRRRGGKIGDIQRVLHISVGHVCCPCASVHLMQGKRLGCGWANSARLLVVDCKGCAGS